MEELGRIFSETEGRDDLLLMEDALDPSYLRSNESETAPISPPFLTPHTPHNSTFPTVSSPTSLTSPPSLLPNSSPNINFNFFSSLTSLLPSTTSTSNTTPINLTISHHSSSTSSKTPEQTSNTFQVFNVFSSVSALSPSTSASSSSSTPSSAQSSSTESFNTATTTTTANTTAGGSSGGCAMSTEDASEDLYAEAACEVCYKAKRSCDRRVPCGRCVRLSRTHLCIQRVRKTPRPRKLKEMRHGSMSFLNKRPSEITIGPSSNNSWMLENKNKVPRLAPHHIVQASIVQSPSDIKQSPSLQPQQLNPVPSSSHLHPQSLLQQHQHSQQLPPHHQQPQPPPPPSQQQVSPRHHPLPRLSSPSSTQPSTTTHTSPKQSHSQLSQSQTTSTLTSTPQLQTMTQLLGIESIDWLSFFADLGSTINGTLLPLISLAIKLEEKPKWGNQLNPFALRTHEEKWITTWHDTISTNREALNKSAFLVKFDRVLCLSMLHLTKGSIQDLFISMFQQQERELFKKRSSPIPSTSSTTTSSTSSPPHPSSSSPQSPAAKLENNLREVLATTTQQLTQQLSSNSLNNNDNDTIATPLPVIMKGYVSNPCDLHATVVIQWSRKEPKDGLPPHVTLELGSNKEMQRLFGYESRELETDPHIFSRLMHPKDWSTLLSKACNAWIKGSTYMALFATCISKRYIEFPCLLEFRSKVVKEEQALRVYCFFIPVPTTP